jgi:hypothetical protein
VSESGQIHLISALIIEAAIKGLICKPLGEEVNETTFDVLSGAPEEHGVFVGAIEVLSTKWTSTGDLH